MTDTPTNAATGDAIVAGPVSPTPPAKASPESIEAARKQALELAGTVRTEVQDITLNRRLSTFGADVEEEAGRNLDLLDGRLGGLMKQLDGENAPIAGRLVDLRRVMDELNPQVQLENAKNPTGVLRMVPKFLRKVPGIGDILADMAVKYESVQSQIDGITDGLRGGCDQLLHDNVEFEHLYRKVQQTHEKVRLVAFQGEVLWAELDRAKADVTDEAERRRIDALIGKIARRVQDLRVMEQVFQQFYASIELTTDNNLNLIDSAKRTITVTTNLLQVGLAIQVALHRQKKVAHAVQETQRYTSDLLAANAATIRQQTGEINELMNNPVLAMDKVKAAYDDLMAAMDETERVRALGVEKARTNIAEVKQMSAGLEERTDAFRSVKAAEQAMRLPEGEQHAT